MNFWSNSVCNCKNVVEIIVGNLVVVDSPIQGFKLLLKFLINYEDIIPNRTEGDAKGQTIFLN